MSDIRAKRVYEDAHRDDGMRVLVDRVWPRGMTKAAAAADLWLKEIAPSTALRKWFNHDRAKWSEFKRRYALELDANTAAVTTLLKAAQQGRLTLLFSAQEAEHNQAVALQEYLMTRLKKPG